MYVCVRGVATVRDAQRIKQDRTRVTQTRCKHSVFGVFWSFWSGTTVKKKKSNYPSVSLQKNVQKVS